MYDMRPYVAHIKRGMEQVHLYSDRSCIIIMSLRRTEQVAENYKRHTYEECT